MTTIETPTLAEVLQEFARRAPDTFTYSNVMEPLCRFRVGGQIHAVEAADPSDADLDLLQGALQRFCEARGWVWSVGRDRRWAGKFLAYVERGQTHGGMADTPAHALSLAVLAALKAEVPV